MQRGSSKNPYTQSEFDALCDANNWHGGYVEGQGYVGPLVVVDGSYSSGSSESSWSEDSWSSECSQSDDSQNISDSNTSSNSSTNSQGGSNNSPNKNDSKTGKEEAEKELVSTVEGLTKYGKRIYALAKELKEKNIIRIEDSVDTNPHYDPQSKNIIWPYNCIYGEEGLTHELFHYLQDKFRMLGNNCSSNNEMQAYVMNYIIRKAVGERSRLKCFEDHNDWDNVDQYITQENILIDEKVNLCYDEELINVLNRGNWKELIKLFSKYYENTPLRHTYSEGISDSYSYNWEELFRQIAIKHNKK